MTPNHLRSVIAQVSRRSLSTGYRRNLSPSRGTIYESDRSHVELFMNSFMAGGAGMLVWEYIQVVEHGRTLARSAAEYNGTKTETPLRDYLLVCVKTLIHGAEK